MNTRVISCTLPLPTNYRITDILSFHVRDAQAVAEIVYSDRLHKGIVWQGSPSQFCTSVFIPVRNGFGAAFSGKP